MSSAGVGTEQVVLLLQVALAEPGTAVVVPVGLPDFAVLLAAELDGAELLVCDGCGSTVEVDDALLCACGAVMHSTCTVVGVVGPQGEIDTEMCHECADRITELAAIARGEHLTLIPGGA